MALLGSNVFDGVKALEEFNRTGMRWFSEEQKLFSHNMELMERARAKAAQVLDRAQSNCGICLPK